MAPNCITMETKAIWLIKCGPKLYSITKFLKTKFCVCFKIIAVYAHLKSYLLHIVVFL
ncbi:hypothetical protein ACE6H2_026364 [Prunus campanulata]